MCDGCNTSQATTAANPQAQAAYTDVVGKAQAVAGTPYQPFGGELVAGLNSGQNNAVNQLGATYGAAQPYIRQGSADMAQAGAGLGNVGQYLQAGSEATANVQPYQAAAADQYAQGNALTLMGSTANQGVGQYLGLAQGAYGQAQGYAGQAAGAFGQAQGYAGQAAGAFGQEAAGLGQVGSYLGKADGYFGQAAGLAAPQDFSGADGVSKYMSPYQQSVIDSTMAWAKQNDASQMSSLVGNAIGSGAYGGDRNGIAVGTLAGQQDMADQSTVAGLNAANYAQATQQFNAVQGQRQQGAQILSGLGSGELSAAGTQLNTALGYGQAGAGYAGLGSLANQTGSGFSGLGSLADQTGSGYAGLGTLQGQVAGQFGSLAANSNAVGAGYLGTGQLGLGTAAQYGQLGTLQGTTGQAYGTLGGQYGQLGAANQSSLISGASAGLQGATLQQQNAQQQDTAAYNQYMAGLSYPYQNVGFLSNIVQGIGSQEGNTQTTQGNALSSIAGLGTSSIGILGATGAFGANGYLSGLGSAASGALSFSDARVKENIAPVGKTFDGQTLHRYNYKGENPARPQIGLIAQEVAKRDPGAVGDMGGGILGVNYDRATADSARMGLGGVGRFAAMQGADLAARMAKADGGPVFGQPGLGAALTQPGMAPNLGAPAPMMMRPGLAARPHFLDGGPVDPTAPIPAGGLNMSPATLLGGGGLNTGAGLGAGRPIQVAQPPTDGGSAGLGALTASPSAGLGSPVSFSGPSQPGAGAISFSGATKDDGSNPAGGTTGGGFSGLGGLSQNAWMGVLAAGLGMMGGHSASAANNIGAGGLAGLQTYLGLQQQDKGNAVQQQKLALEKQGLDQTGAYQQATLGLDQKKVDLSTKQLEAEIANQQRQAGIQSAQIANQTANTGSEIAARNQATAQGRYSRVFIPGVGYSVTDLNNPTAPPVMLPLGGASSPTATSTLAPAAAPPPQGGVSASGSPVAGEAMPGSAPVLPAAITPTPAPARPMSPAATQGAGPQSVSSLVPASVPQGWKPTTAVPQGYVPPNSMGIAMSGDGGKAQAEIGQKQVEGLQTNAGKAASAQMQLYQMNAAIDGLPKTGLLAPGAYGDERAHVANSLNGIAQTFGAQPLFSENQTADAQELAKGAFRLGTSMIADTNGGREAGFILQNSVKNVPSINNSYLGFKRVAAGIDQANQYAIDKANFISDYYAKFHHVDGADATFNKLNPWQNYAQRAIDSSTMPSAPPAGVPAGSAYSMSRQQWRAPDGSIYGANGQRAQ